MTIAIDMVNKIRAKVLATTCTQKNDTVDYN